MPHFEAHEAHVLKREAQSEAQSEAHLLKVVEGKHNKPTTTDQQKTIYETTKTRTRSFRDPPAVRSGRQLLTPTTRLSAYCVLTLVYRKG